MSRKEMSMLKMSMIVSFLSANVFGHSTFSNDSTSAGIVALILARGGSKGIKLKNIQTIDGMTLLGISLSEIQKTEFFESIWVSTDHDDIAREALKCEYLEVTLLVEIFVKFSQES